MSLPEYAFGTQYPVIFTQKEDFFPGFFDKAKAELVPGYIYLRNYETSEVTSFIDVKTTSFALSDNNDLYIAEDGGKIYKYSLDGSREKLLVDLSAEKATIKNLIANNYLIYFTVEEVVYRYFISTSQLDKLGTIDVSDPITFKPLSNTSVLWQETSNIHYQCEEDFLPINKVRNFATQKTIIVDESNADTYFPGEAENDYFLIQFPAILQDHISMTLVLLHVLAMVLVVLME